MKGEKRKLVISKTITFLFIVGFIILFKKIFGDENTLIGVTTITGALMFLERNLTTRKERYFFELLVLNIGLGIFSYIAGLNPILALIFNFISMFIIGYIFSYDIRSHMYVPFGLQYVFMLAVPVDLSGLYNRILSLIFSSIFIMVVQIIVNRNKIEKEGIPAIKNLIDITINLLKSEDIKKDKELKLKFDSISIKLKEIIYNSKKENFHIETNGKAMIDIVIFLRSICNRKFEIEDKEMYVEALKKINLYIEEKRDLRTLNEIDFIDTDLDLKVISKLLINLQNKKDKNNFVVSEELKSKNKSNRYFNKNSMSFRYAIRIGITIGLSSFIVDYFNIFQGKWMLFTIFALIQPYSEYGKIRTIQRMQGTFIGAIIAFVLFSLVNNPIIQSVFIIGVGYLDSFHKTYKEKMIYVTISAIGASLILGGTFKMVSTRLILIMLGVVISAIGNKFILPYSIEDAKKELVHMYALNKEKIINEIRSENKNGSLENLYIVSSLIEKKLYEFNYNEEIKNKKEEILDEYFTFKRKVLS
ncbi:FUSC family protein [Clostridium thermobutyricum]|uniref:Inner membrane protein YccS n=1 Tax=Clostridium thermobutyricum DSM 4928 TaxID=1121339 RepID=A0A1V4SS96_9CLOT|nr:FUSC family protein [Clostridium thermobutyricum]OPX46673.1 inner membrane protein YccS [Clostridium thermobutyricum DSM 4928]